MTGVTILGLYVLILWAMSRITRLFIDEGTKAYLALALMAITAVLALPLLVIVAVLILQPANRGLFGGSELLALAFPIGLVQNVWTLISLSRRLYIDTMPGVAILAAIWLLLIAPAGFVPLFLLTPD